MRMKFCAILVMSLFILAACKSDRDEIIPNVSFSIKINVNDDPEYSETSFIVKRDLSGRPAGVCGVVIYRLTSDTYYAFDLMCPYEKRYNCLVEKKDDMTYKCPCCGSEFMIGTETGSILEGPSKWPLKAYQTSVNGNWLSVWN
ncbi:Rieske (2Fe-2S) protein [Marinilabiliaceae bacterium JC017]|nr:Rieske (2Fe-2S) protein [Marinilabiliaceae bacterium JC017]